MVLILFLSNSCFDIEYGAPKLHRYVLYITVHSHAVVQTMHWCTVLSEHEVHCMVVPSTRAKLENQIE